jgi:ATP-binding cassette subfamily B protein
MLLRKSGAARIAGPASVGLEGRLGSADERRQPGAAGFPLRPLAFLWHYVRRRRLLHFAALAAVMGAAASASFAQYGLKMIVDALAQGPGALDRIWEAVGVFTALLACESALWRIGSRLGYCAIVIDKAAARLDLFNHLSGHSSRYFSERMGGALAGRVSATGEAQQQVFQSVLFNIAPVCADFCAALLLMATVGWRLAAAICTFVVLAVGVLMWGSHCGAPRHRRYADRAAEVGGELVDVLSNIWVVKAFAAHSRERGRYARMLDEEACAQRSSLFYIERLRILHDTSLWLMGGGLLVWTILLWNRGQISAGDVVLVVAIAFRILQGSRDLAFALVNTSQFIARIADSLQVIGEDHKVIDRSGARELLPCGGGIAFEKVDFSYPGGHRVFRDFNLRIRPGERVGLVGPSGAGKSTLIALVQRLADVDAGRLLIDGEDIREMTQDSLRAAIAVVPQDITLFHRSVLENIRYAKPEAGEEEIIAAARAARCDDFIRALPQGYETLVGERGSRLSGGQRQRIAIARALLKDAPIVIFDEATSALDSQSEREIQRALEALMRGRTVLAIAHRMATVADFDRIIVLDHGRIAEDGVPAELRRRDGLFAEMCRLQRESAGLQLVG